MSVSTPGKMVPRRNCLASVAALGAGALAGCPSGGGVATYPDGVPAPSAFEEWSLYTTKRVDVSALATHDDRFDEAICGPYGVNCSYGLPPVTDVEGAPFDLGAVNQIVTAGGLEYRTYPSPTLATVAGAMLFAVYDYDADAEVGPFLESIGYERVDAVGGFDRYRDEHAAAADDGARLIVGAYGGVEPVAERLGGAHSSFEDAETPRRRVRERVDETLDGTVVERVTSEPDDGDLRDDAFPGRIAIADAIGIDDSGVTYAGVHLFADEGDAEAVDDRALTEWATETLVREGEFDVERDGRSLVVSTTRERYIGAI